MSVDIKELLLGFIKNKDFDSLKALIDSIPEELDIPQEFSKGSNLLFYANTPDQKIFKYLLDNPKIKKDCIDKSNGTTALQRNIKNISIDDFKKYLDIVSHDDIKFKFGNEPNLMFSCAYKLRWDLVEELLNRNFPIINNDFHDNILSICSRNKKNELVERILREKKYKFIINNFSSPNSIRYSPLNSKLDKCFSEATDLKEFNQLLLDNTLSKKVKLLSDYVFNFSNNQINYVNLTMIDLCFYLKLDFNYVENFIKTNFNNPMNFCISDAEKKILKQIFDTLAAHYPQERIQILFRCIPSCFVTDLAIEAQDILNMIKKVEANNIPLPKKPKSFADLRILLIRLMRKVEQNNYELTPQLGIKVLERIKLKTEELSVHVPVNNFDLIDASHFINICVGSGEYAKKIMDNESLIVLLKSEDKLKYCVELNYDNFFTIIQAKGEGNSAISKELHLELQEEISKIMEHYS